MNEPIYTFVKGQGWVIDNIETYTFSLFDDTKVRVERRLPNNGEHYDSTSKVTSSILISDLYRKNKADEWEFDLVKYAAFVRRAGLTVDSYPICIDRENPTYSFNTRSYITLVLL